MKPKKELYNKAATMQECTDDRNIKLSNPIEQMEKEISILQEEIKSLKFELLDCYRRLDN